MSPDQIAAKGMCWMRRIGGLFLTAFLTAPVWAAVPAKGVIDPGAKLDKAETLKHAHLKAKAGDLTRRLMGSVRIYTTQDSFQKVYRYDRRLFPETDLNLKKTGAGSLPGRS